MAAAPSSTTYSINFHEDELSCPVCFNELEEPKSLPTCAHIICKGCLEKLAAKLEGQFIECPICKRKSRIPEGGVDEIATSHFMKSMVEKIPGRKEKLELQKALKEYEEKLEDSKGHLESINKQIDIATKEHLKRVEEVKHEISEHARKLTELIKEKENRLLSQVDESMKFSFEVLRLKRRKQKILERIGQAEVCTKNVQEHLKNTSLSDIKELKEVLINDLQEHFHKILEPKISLEGIEGDDGIKFEKNMAVFLQDQNILGSVSKTTRKQEVSLNKHDRSQGKAHNIVPLAINLDFEPLTIAVSKSNGIIYIGVLRSKEQMLDILELPDGKRVKSVQLDAVPATHLYDFYFSMKDYTIIVLDRIDRQLLNYSLDGHCRKSKRLTEDIKFISLDELGRILLTTSQNEAAYEDNTMGTKCQVLVFHQKKNEIQFQFGESSLVNPSGRAVYHKDIFYVPDNLSDLKLFDKRGKFIRCVQLNGIDPQDYNVFAIDIYRDLVIACSLKEKGADLKIFNMGDFSLISTFHIQDQPWMIEALPAAIKGKCRFAVIYNDVTRLDVIEIENK